MRYVPQVDEAACLAHGDCAEVAPHVFRVDEVAEVVGEASLEQLLEAAEACPAGAIAVIDTETGDAVYP
jgi:ferredoxin